MFWLPVWEDVAVLQNSARRVFSMVHMFIESGPYMMGPSFAMLSTGDQRSADARPASGSHARGKPRASTTASPGGQAFRAGTLSQAPGATEGPEGGADGAQEGEEGEEVTAALSQDGTSAAPAAASSVTSGAAATSATPGVAHPSVAASVAAATETGVEVLTPAAASAARKPGASTKEAGAGEAGQSPAVKPAKGDGMTTSDGDGIAEAAEKAATAAAAAIAGEESSTSSSSPSSNERRVKAVSGKAGKAEMLKVSAGYRIVPVCPVSKHHPPELTPSGEAEDSALELL